MLADLRNFLYALAQQDNETGRQAECFGQYMPEIEEALRGLQLIERGDDNGEPTEVWLLLRARMPRNIGAGSIRLTGEFAKSFSRHFALVRKVLGE